MRQRAGRSPSAAGGCGQVVRPDVFLFILRRGDTAVNASLRFSIHRIAPDDVGLMHGLLRTFGEAFDEVETYGGNRPDAAYLRRLLGSDCFIALAALKDGEAAVGTHNQGMQVASRLPLVV